MSHIVLEVDPDKALFPGEHLTFLHSGPGIYIPFERLQDIVQEVQRLMPFVGLVSGYEQVTKNGELRLAWKIDIPHRLHKLHGLYSSYHDPFWGEWKPHITPKPGTSMTHRKPGTSVNFIRVRYSP